MMFGLVELFDIRLIIEIIILKTVAITIDKTNITAAYIANLLCFSPYSLRPITIRINPISVSTPPMPPSIATKIKVKTPGRLSVNKNKEIFVMIPMDIPIMRINKPLWVLFVISLPISHV